MGCLKPFRELVLPSPFEAEISSLLREHGSAALVAQAILQRWRLRLLNDDEQFDFAQFLVASGLYTKLLTEIPSLIRDGARLPWAQFAECLGRTGTKPDQIEVQALFDGAEMQGAVGLLLRSRQLDLYHRQFGERRDQFLRTREEQIIERREALKDKLQFVRGQRLFEQEAEVLEEIQAIFPDEEELKADKEAYELRVAKEVIAKNASGTDLSVDLQWKMERLSGAELSAKDLIVARAKEMAKEDPFSAYDLAVSLHLMDFHAEAVEVISLAGRTPAAEWLRIELMIRARQFVTALDEAARMEVQYAGDPDATFAIVYIRARALYGLGQTAMAVELLRSLVKIRPQYKSAHSLLIDWSGGDA